MRKSFKDAWFEFDFMILKEHIDSIEELLEENVKEMDKRIDKEAEEITDKEERGEYYSSCSDDI